MNGLQISMSHTITKCYAKISPDKSFEPQPRLSLIQTKKLVWILATILVKFLLIILYSPSLSCFTSYKQRQINFFFLFPVEFSSTFSLWPHFTNRKNEKENYDSSRSNLDREEIVQNVVH